MFNSVIFFHLYLLVVLIFLSIFSFFLSKHLFIFVSKNLKIVSLFSNLKKKMYLNEDNYTNLFSLYLFRENLFLSVALSELILEVNHELTKKDVVYAFLAYVYYQYSFYSISEYYYLKILSSSPYNYKIMLNLANMYSKLHYKTKANDFFVRAGSLEFDNLFLK
uniref:hypothetical protein n=1 Tax=Rhodomelopsis africana TaxID=1917047 RepID=UPI0022FD9892|nr:hypothetical protein PN024_pgp192 [Rhodomelopsis africana]WAX02616.1 hypothetical protein [Rhodomelopsis africana]